MLRMRSADERRKAATVVVRLDSIAHVPYAEAVRMLDAMPDKETA